MKKKEIILYASEPDWPAKITSSYLRADGLLSKEK